MAKKEYRPPGMNIQYKNIKNDIFTRTSNYFINIDYPINASIVSGDESDGFIVGGTTNAPAGTIINIVLGGYIFTTTVLSGGRWEREVTLYDAENGKTYSILVTVSNDYFVKTTASIFVIYDSTLPTAPILLEDETIANITSLTITFKKSKVTSGDVKIKHYLIFINGIENEEVIEHEESEDVTMDYNISGLEPNKDYSIYLVAVTEEDKESPKSNTITVKTELDSGKPSFVGNEITLEDDDIVGDDGNIRPITRIKWKQFVDTHIIEQDGESVSYIVSYSIDIDKTSVADEESIYPQIISNIDTDTGRINDDDVEYVVGRFEYGHTYQITVKATDYSGNVSDPLVLNFDTRAPLAPKLNIIDDADIEDTRVKISWEPSPELFGEYTISYYEVYVDGLLYVNNVLGNNVYLEGLEAEETYSIYVKSVNSLNKKSPQSNARIVTTKSSS